VNWQICRVHPIATHYHPSELCPTRKGISSSILRFLIHSTKTALPRQNIPSPR